jgi:murein endopeptidase
MRQVFFALLFAVVIGGVFVYTQAVQYKAAEAYMPSVVRVTAQMPDTGRVCVEPEQGGLDSCRSIKDLRKWVREVRAK